MSLSKSELVDWRDQIIEEMKRITKAPGSISGAGGGLDNQKRMTMLQDQLLAVNRLLSLLDGPRAMKLDGLDT
jgi:hypothetical protein